MTIRPVTPFDSAVDLCLLLQVWFPLEPYDITQLDNNSTSPLFAPWRNYQEFTLVSYFDVIIADIWIGFKFLQLIGFEKFHGSNFASLENWHLSTISISHWMSGKPTSSWTSSTVSYHRKPSRCLLWEAVVVWSSDARNSWKLQYLTKYDKNEQLWRLSRISFSWLFILIRR